MPLVVALHGGGGHGRDFLWNWVRDARSRGVLVLSPTARDRTWSVMTGEDVDVGSLYELIATVTARYAVDPARVLLTGMSDGATYTLVAGLYEDRPFTHLAPACGTLHPFVLAGGALDRAKGRPVYVIHGARDWMFPIEHGRVIQHLLATAGARVVYREIADLSHTYPRDENPAILDWLIDGRAPAAATTWPPPTI
jgi:phospholipase/carboxylesterase